VSDTPNLSVGIDEKKLREQVDRLFNGLLNKEEIGKVYNQAISKALTATRHEWVDRVRATYHDREGVPYRSVMFYRGNSGGLEGGHFLVTGGLRALTEANYDKGSGPHTWAGSPAVSAQNLAESGLKGLPGKGNIPPAFYATLNKGRHKALMQRVSKGDDRDKPASEKYRNAAGTARAKKGWDTTKIEQLLAPSYPHMFASQLIETSGHKKRGTVKNFWIGQEDSENIIGFMLEAFDDEIRHYLVRKLANTPGAEVIS